MTSICIIAYTDYLTDARVMRQAESAREAGYAVDVVTPRSPGQDRTLALNGVTVHRLRTSQYRGIRKTAYVLSYLDFFFRCLVRVSRLHVDERLPRRPGLQHARFPGLLRGRSPS